jgi:hypothetical protein
MGDDGSRSVFLRRSKKRQTDEKKFTRSKSVQDMYHTIPNEGEDSFLKKMRDDVGHSCPLLSVCVVIVDDCEDCVCDVSV